jgi:hypothetical protein
VRHAGQFGKLGGALRASGQVVLERLPVGLVEQAERVRGGVGVQRRPARRLAASEPPDLRACACGPSACSPAAEPG